MHILCATMILGFAFILTFCTQNHHPKRLHVILLTTTKKSSLSRDDCHPNFTFYHVSYFSHDIFNSIASSCFPRLEAIDTCRYYLKTKKDRGWCYVAWEKLLW